MPKLTIDGTEITVEDGLTVLQACELAGKEIPRFCYHERLAIAGNCRMCLVEMEKSPKPIASCAMTASEGMVIHTNTPKVKKAREGVMEFLLVNHPLDCPICDQGGECDLQDQAFKYGRPTNRFHENKRSIPDKYMGPLIKTHMTRCIQCTRCIRFATDVAGIEEMGAVGRGEHMEVTTYVESALTSELSGNMIDICPVGALTSKPYAFKARSWELRSTESVDVMDATGCNIRVDARGLEVMRILPKLNEDINEEWISDKTRFVCDGLKYQRLDRPYIRKNGKLVESSWDEALALVASKLQEFKGEEMGAIAGTLVDIESMAALKSLMNRLGSHNLDANQFGYKFDISKRENYLFNTGIAGLEDVDLCLLIGANPREAAPVLNARIGRLQRSGHMHVARIGEVDDQTYKIEELGNSAKIIDEITKGKHAFCARLKDAKKPIVIIGDGVYSRADGLALQAAIREMADEYGMEWNLLHNHASMVGSLDLGFCPSLGLDPRASGDEENSPDPRIAAKLSPRKTLNTQQMASGAVKLLYLLGADEIDIDPSVFVIYQGHHGDRGANRADVILPGYAYTEKDGTYVNMEGLAQKGRKAVDGPGQARDDVGIIEGISEVMKSCHPRVGGDPGSNKHAKGDNINNDLVKLDPRLRGDDKSGEVDKIPITKVHHNFYMTDPISRASPTMAKCTEARAKPNAPGL